MRQCPTLDDRQRPLIAHCIPECQCLERQREHYHKCHRCIYRGKSPQWEPGSATLVLTPSVPAGATNGVVKGLAKAPSPQST